MGQVMRNLRGAMPLLQLRLLLVLLMLVAAVVVVAGVARARIHGPKVLSSIVPILVCSGHRSVWCEVVRTGRRRSLTISDYHLSMGKKSQTIGRESADSAS